MPYLDMQGEVPAITDPFITYQIYNCLDAAVTAQLVPAMAEGFTPNTLYTYRREMELQSLCLDMSTKGFPIDNMALADLLWQLERNENRALHILHACCEAVGYAPINPNSPKQVAHFFYTYLGLPAITEYDRVSKTQKISTDIKALEQLRVQFDITAPFINAILCARENRKMASVFKKGLEPMPLHEWRKLPAQRNNFSYVLRCNFSPSGTETGRLSSQQNPYQRGTNAQNMTNQVRGVVEAPAGYTIVNFDLKTAESLAVGFRANDKVYIEACQSGDVHTYAARLNWPRLQWTGTLKLDKKIAEQPYYRQFSYRDMAKRGGHGTNYYGTPPTMAKHLKLPTHIVASFQTTYFKAFPGIQRWHLSTIAKLQATSTLTNAMRRERRFWGRVNDKATWREAIAFDPQSIVADVMNEGLIRLQRYILEHEPDTQLIAQVHDAGVLLVPTHKLARVLPIYRDLLRVAVNYPDAGEMVIESDCQVGEKWYKSKTDPKALRDFQFA